MWMLSDSPAAQSSRGCSRCDIPNWYGGSWISGVNITPEGLNPEGLQELRASQFPNPRAIDEKPVRLWLTSPTGPELSVVSLSKLYQSVLVIAGDRDAITMEHTLRIFHALSKGELSVLPGTDHAKLWGLPG